jgi:hypothetical protein
LRRNIAVCGTIAALFVATLLLTPLSFVSATTPISISGKWIGITSSIVGTNWRIAGANSFMEVYNQGTYVSGDILGSFEQTFVDIRHFSDPEIAQSLVRPVSTWPETAYQWKDMVRSFEGTVLGVSGGFTMLLEAKCYGNNLKGPTYYDTEGTWVITGGTGDLAGVHGQGTWWHIRTGFTGQEYEGQIHFEP